MKDRITEVASTYMPTYLEKKSDIVDSSDSAAKVTVVKFVESNDSIDSKSDKYVGSDESIENKSEKETKELDDSVSDDLKKR